MSDVAGNEPWALRGKPARTESVAERTFKIALGAAERAVREDGVVTVEGVHSRLPSHIPMSRVHVADLLAEPKFIAAAQARGLELADGGLTARQMDALTAYFDNAGGEGLKHDRRLRAAGITQTQWRGWMLQPEFRQRADELAKDRLGFTSSVTAREALSDLVEGRDLNAIKFAMQMTGEYDPNRPQVDIGRVLNELLALLDEYAAVLPPNFMTTFAGRLQNEILAPEAVRVRSLPPARKDD